MTLEDDLLHHPSSTSSFTPFPHPIGSRTVHLLPDWLPSVCGLSHEQDDDVDEKQADEDEGEVDEELLEVPLGLGVHLDHGRPPDGCAGHVLNSLHGWAGVRGQNTHQRLLSRTERQAPSY